MSYQVATKYQIVESLDPYTLQEKVEAELQLGWHLYGPPMLGHSDYQLWAQALIRVD